METDPLKEEVLVTIDLDVQQHYKENGNLQLIPTSVKLEVKEEPTSDNDNIVNDDDHDFIAPHISLGCQGEMSDDATNTGHKTSTCEYCSVSFPHRRYKLKHFETLAHKRNKNKPSELDKEFSHKPSKAQAVKNSDILLMDILQQRNTLKTHRQQQNNSSDLFDVPQTGSLTYSACFNKYLHNFYAYCEQL